MAQFRKPFPKKNLQILGGASLVCAGMAYAIVQGFEEQRNVNGPQPTELQPNLGQPPVTGMPQLPIVPGKPLPSTTLTIPTLPPKIPQLPSQTGTKSIATPSQPIQIPTQSIPSLPSNLQTSLTFPNPSLTKPGGVSSQSPGASQSAKSTQNSTSPNLQPGELLPNLPDPLEMKTNPEPAPVPAPPVRKSIASPPPVSAYGTPSADHLKLSPSQFSDTPLLKPEDPKVSQPPVEDQPNPDPTQKP
ncbi:MAG: hypothetical protein WCD18_26045 [Thermosynechococcaceae cyanobacterium]